MHAEQHIGVHVADLGQGQVLRSFHRFPLGLGPSNRRLTRREPRSTAIDLAPFAEPDDDIVLIVQQLAGNMSAVPPADEVEKPFSRLHGAIVGVGAMRCYGLWVEHAL
jgi:hypothetical protein